MYDNFKMILQRLSCGRSLSAQLETSFAAPSTLLRRPGLSTKRNSDFPSRRIFPRAVSEIHDAPSWADLQVLVQSKGTELGDPSLTQEDYFETGPTNSFALKRTHGKSDPIRVKLYRDSAAWCPFCQRVWIQLEEKKIPYVIEKINLSAYGKKPESFLKISPKGLVPVMELDGKVILESDEISKVLEKEFPEIPLLPPEGISVGVLVAKWMCPGTKSYEKFEEISSIQYGWIDWFRRSGEESKEKEKQVLENIAKLEAYLASSESLYFLDEGFSLTDIRVITVLERLACSALYYKGLKIQDKEKYPNLTKWFEAMTLRPCYLATRSDYYTNNSIIKRFVRDDGKIDKEAEQFAEVIDGRKGWELPLPALSSSSVEPYAPGEDPKTDTYQAGKKLVTNHEAVVKFALKGLIPKTEDTSEDSQREIDEEAFQATDLALRFVAEGLLRGVEEVQPSQEAFSSETADKTVAALKYVRDHVGVPRDLTYPAARQFRAHLNWLIHQFA